MATSNRIWAVAALMAMVSGFTACLKTEDVKPSRPVAAFTLIQGIPTTSLLDFYDNSVKEADTVKVGFAGYNHQAYRGLHLFELKRTGTATTIVSTPPTIEYDSLNYYTLVAYGDSANPAFRVIKDDFTGLTTGAVNIRFLHLAPSISAVDVYLGTTKVDSNRIYEGGSMRTSFSSITSVSGANSITIKKAGSDSVYATSSSASMSLSTGNVYTIFLTGVKGDSSSILKPKVGYIPSYY